MSSEPRRKSSSFLEAFQGALQAGSLAADQSRRILPFVRAYGGFSRRQAREDRGESLGRIGQLEVRLAANASEVRRAQKLRWTVFYEQGGAIADAASGLVRRDIDAFDAICDHLIVIDHAQAERTRFGQSRPMIVGTYRLLRQDVADRHGGFYTQSEFDIESLVSRHKGLRFLELGRSCVLAPYRNKRTVELLWHGIWTYVLRHRIDVMFGCASLEGTDPQRLSLELSFLHHNARAPREWAAAPLQARHCRMDRLEASAVDMKRALHALPPLVKGYLRLGAYVGDGAVIDRQFGTTDVLIVLPVGAINPRYVDHFGPQANRHAA